MSIHAVPSEETGQDPLQSSPMIKTQGRAAEEDEEEGPFGEERGPHRVLQPSGYGEITFPTGFPYRTIGYLVRASNAEPVSCTGR